ncbi:peptide chain release factor N(5)-glutamine methyltransferase [Parvicella tangerina]|uniref:peptide chain release factor N(5)-glutamine methyltransferase n=1 Tax=Parvicella tangerina TaxID=2829795 RepID=A0A916N9R2_9FLAO|nr:peptide chain release factor N(5)-glutamine methyltransferase [Parvicella tangerina]CAG5077761.1 Release factor glutamine methyltransferase [Parvicella tangerina]
MPNVNEITLISSYLFVNMFVQINTLQAVKEYFEEGLASVYSSNEITTLFEITCEHFMGWNKLEQKMKLDAKLSESELLDFHFTLKRLRNSEPIQYILGEAPFYGLNLKVSSATLIPRPETEELVGLIIRNISPIATVIDIGTGTGCIPIAINHQLPNTQVFATDISEEALKIATENSRNSTTKISFARHDILHQNDLPESFPEQFDVMISNPPYVKKIEQLNMQKSVLNYEPHLALFVDDDDPLVFYHAIAQLAANKLKKGGTLYFEINQYLGLETKQLVEGMGFTNVTIVKDINSNDRILYAEK